MDVRRTACLAGASLLLSSSITAQEPAVFSVTSELVVVHVTVKDRRGAYVSGLPREAFAVVEDGQPQTIRFLADTDTPVTVGLLIDSSGSMYANRARVIAAAAAFADASHPQDELFALSFNEIVRAALPAETPFTRDTSMLRAALERSVSARGRTALYDAISAGLDYLSKASHQRKVLVVVSDRGDNASRESLAPLLTKAQASNAVIYTIALRDGVTRDANPKLLKQIAETSGGEAFQPDDAREIPDVLRHIARDIRHTYTIGYEPTNTRRDGAFRSVRVAVQSATASRLTVRTRAGYVAGAAR